jgi:hypothetical protein
LVWDVNFQCHELYQKCSDNIDPLFWMTQDYKVEVQAQTIEDDANRELFCCNFEGHWSKEHKQFFRFPPKKVGKPEDGN